MAKVVINHHERVRLTNIMSTYLRIANPLERRSFYDESGLSSQVPKLLTELREEIAVHDFCYALVSALERRGILPETSNPALYILLDYIKKEIQGHPEDAAFIETLLNMPVEKTPSSPPSEIRFTEALSKMAGEDWEEALYILEELRQEGFSPRFIDIQKLINDCQTAINRQQMLEAYNEVRTIYHNSITRRFALDAWQQFLQKYPDFSQDDDSENLLNKIIPSDYSKTLIEIINDTSKTPLEKLKAGIKLGEIGDKRRGVGLREEGIPDIWWIEIPESTTIIGRGSNLPQVFNSMAATPLLIKTFYISCYPITNQQFQTFINDASFFNKGWWDSSYISNIDSIIKPPVSRGESNFPRTNINYYEAKAFCRWLSEKLGFKVELPNENAWEKSARGFQESSYPWGNEYIIGYANIDETTKMDGIHNLMSATPVGMYPQGASPYGVMDVSGNVWEWTSSWYYPSGISPHLTVRGGSWDFDRLAAMVTSRRKLDPLVRSHSLGFRVVRSIE